MIFNINGNPVQGEVACFPPISRCYRYGDGFFESMKLSNGLLLHSVLHWERIVKTALLLKIDLPGKLNREVLISRIQETAKSENIANARVRCTIFRETEGFYIPDKQECTVVIELQPLNTSEYHYNETGLSLGAFKELTKNSNFISTLKTTSALIYVLAGLYSSENQYDDCVIFNDLDRVAETVNSNIFTVSGEFILTPPLSEYCIDGVMRKVVMNLATAYGYSVIEQPLSEISLTSADEIFLTNAANGIRWVGQYKGKSYHNTVSRILAEKLNPTS